MNRLDALEPWSAPPSLGKRTREKLLVPIGLTTAPPTARVVMVNFDELERLGIPVPAGRRLTSELETELLTRFAVRPIEEGERAQLTGFATRYQGYPGYVQGDGRAVMVAQAAVIDSRGRRRERVDVQLKGVATGLLPKRKDWASRNGRMFLSRAIQEALYADFLAANGVASNRWLAIIDAGHTITRPSDSVEFRVGWHLRTGNFWRMGHLWHFADDRRALRDVLTEVRQVLAQERGRRALPSLERTYHWLLRKKAIELADAWWLRYVHGSYTPDNVGLFECLDQGTACTIDRNHPSFSAHRVGYSHAAAMLMGEDYKRILPEALRKIATPAERRRLVRIAPGQVTGRWFERRMAFQLLRHLGVEERVAQRLLHRHRDRAIAWWTSFRALADAVDRGRESWVGRQAAFRVRHAAHFDVFRAIQAGLRLATIARFTEAPAASTVRARAQRLLATLRPEADRTGRDLLSAVSFLELLDEVIARSTTTATRLAELRLMRERAAVLGRRSSSLEGGDSLTIAERFVNGLQNLVPMSRVRAWLRIVSRRNVIDGPGTSIWAARELRTGRTPRLPDGRWIVSRVIENGVEFQQVSDGVRDAFRFVVTRRMTREASTSLRLELRWSGVWRRSKRTSMTDDELVFEVPIDRPLPRRLRARFVGTRRFTNGGLGYARDVPLLFSSLEVQLELARLAKARGQHREIPEVLKPLVG